MTRHKKTFLLMLLFLVTTITPLLAYEEFAEQTGQDCAVCHLDPAGGGALTAEGKGYALSLDAKTTSSTSLAEKPVTTKLFRGLVGYLHILFAFFWFGTILYIHLILKPAYASRGLPRSEVKLGLASMVIMGVSGAILFSYRVPDPAILLNSRFGILLLLKIILYLIMVSTALFAVFFIGPRMRRQQTVTTEPKTGELTLAELAQFDGKDGRKAYFAYRGEIFDATDSPLWKNGTHMGRHQTGVDLTEMLNQAPHEEDKIKAMTKVGKLRPDEAGSSLSPPQKLFYTIAYMNLGIVLLIILILACWKWW